MLIKGIPVVLHEIVPGSGTSDPFGHSEPTTRAVTVKNVIVSPVSSDAVVTELQLSGHHASYELSIPKADRHTWKGCQVDFFGKSWRVFTPEKEWIDDMIPLEWNRKVMVERFE